MTARKPAPQQVEEIRGVVAPVAAAAGLDLEGVSVRRAGSRLVVRILIDADGGVSLDTVAEVSRAMSAALDDNDALGEQSYLLDVGSPGVDRPLTLLRHWRRNIGRLVRVTPVDGDVQTGRITAAEGPADDQPVGSVEIEVAGAPLALMGGQIRRAVVQVEFS